MHGFDDKPGQRRWGEWPRLAQLARGGAGARHQVTEGLVQPLASFPRAGSLDGKAPPTHTQHPLKPFHLHMPALTHLPRELSLSKLQALPFDL